MADTDLNFFTRSGARNVADFVRRLERRPTNNVQHWRANKYVLGMPGEICWGLTPRGTNPILFMSMGLRIENAPSDEIEYGDPDGKYASIDHAPLGLLAHTWYPLQKPEDPATQPYRMMVADCWMQGVFGDFTDYATPSGRPGTGNITIDGGIANGLKVLTSEPTATGPAAHDDRPTYAMRSALLSEHQTIIVSQPCDADEE